MPPDLLSWLSLAVKLGLTAGIVVTASIVSERAGPLIGALVVTLPVTVWPAYLFLALEQDDAFLAATAVGGLAISAVNAIFMLVYAAAAQRRNLAVSMAAALATWLVLAAAARSYPWTMSAAVVLNLIVYPTCMWLGSGFRDVRMPPVRRKWYDVPFRAMLVCTLMGTVLLISNMVGPIATGFVAVFPISTASTILILHSRVGGQATAAVVANGIAGMAGISLGLAALNLTIPWWGKAGALAAALFVPVLWNLGVWATRTQRIAFFARRVFTARTAAGRLLRQATRRRRC